MVIIDLESIIYFSKREKMKKIIFILVLLFSVNSFARMITVAVAANAQYAMKALSHAFTKKTGIYVQSVVSSSGKLTAMIKSGAPFNLFLSANMKYPMYLYKHNLAITKPKIYAKGSLVLWTLKKVSLKDKIDTLKNPSILTVAIPNPASAPYGVQAVDAMRNAKIFTDVKSKIIYADSIAQTNQYIYSKSVDLGITAKSVVMSPKMKDKGHYVDIAPSLYNSLQQGVVVLKYADTSNKLATMKFYHFIFSQKAKSIFKQFGYILPK